MLLAVATGFLLFSVRPLTYAQNPAFLTKISLVALGVVNALVLQLQAGTGGSPPRAGRCTARCGPWRALSLLIWAGAVLAGRWIGFLQ